MTNIRNFITTQSTGYKPRTQYSSMGLSIINPLHGLLEQIAPLSNACEPRLRNPNREKKGKAENGQQVGTH
jgi:hypothetical protein